MKLAGVLSICMYVVLLSAIATNRAGAQTITQIMDAGFGLDYPQSIAVDGSCNIYVIGHRSHNVFKITPDPDGTITEIIDSSGDGGPDDGLERPYGIAVDGSGNVYVSGSSSHNVFKITSGGDITEIIDYVYYPHGIAVDGSGNLYVARPTSHCASKYSPDGGFLKTIIDSSGDGIHGLDGPIDIAVDGEDNVYVLGLYSHNVFKITPDPDGTITQIIDSSGDGLGNTLSNPWSLTVDGADNVYVSGHASDNVFKITPLGAKNLIIDIDADPDLDNRLKSPRDIAVDDSGNVYVAGNLSSNAFKITTGGSITQIINADGDGAHPLQYAYGITVDSSGNVYVSGHESDNVFKITPAAPADLEGPVTSNVAIDPVAVIQDAVVFARVDDSGTGGSNIASARYFDGSWLSMQAVDGAYDSQTEDVRGAITSHSEPGVYEICVMGIDEAENEGNPECALLAVYDPDGGFVTGGGWIDSPLGAYADNMLLTGKANFGFVSKYKKGATTPTGNTEFQFKAGDLNFHSSSYEWLVVTGSNYARFKGSGTINGSGDYKFMLWAGDGPDTFRIRIWEEDESTGVETDVYDNGSDQAIGGGSIVIHTK